MSTNDHLDDPFHPDWEISVRETERRRRGGDAFLLVDCRTAPERQVGSIAGSLFVPMDDLSQHVESLRDYEDRLVVVYCRSGRRSLDVAAALRGHGFTDVRSMAGGIIRWAELIDPSVPTG